MKKGFLLIMSFIVFFTTKAQNFENGGNYISAGYGLASVNPITDAISAPGSSTIGPFLVIYERGITELLGIGRVGIGAEINQTFYRSVTNTYNIFNQSSTEITETRSRFGVLARGAYHYAFHVPKIDFYTGVGLGFHFNKSNSTEEESTDPWIAGDPDVFNSFSLAHSVFAGIRYFVKGSLGLYSELGFGTTSFINAGLVFKF